MATFVLVHGTSCGGWVWQKTAPLLRAEGHAVYTPTLTGIGDRSHLMNCGVNLTTHIKDIANLLFYEDLSDVVLVGHSYGGMVITGVAASMPERLKLLIFLDAYVPNNQQSESELWPAEMQAEIQADEAAGRGLSQPPPLDIMGITDPEMASWVKTRLTPQPLATYSEAVAAGDKRTAVLPRAFIHCTGGPTMPVFAPFAEKARGEGWEVHELATGHLAMLTMPNEVVKLILKITSTHL